MGKNTTKGFRPIYPTPAAMITSVAASGKPNIITLGEVFNVSLGNPPIVVLTELLHADNTRACHSRRSVAASLGVGELASDFHLFRFRSITPTGSWAVVFANTADCQVDDFRRNVQA